MFGGDYGKFEQFGLFRGGDVSRALEDCLYVGDFWIGGCRLIGLMMREVDLVLKTRFAGDELGRVVSRRRRREKKG